MRASNQALGREGEKIAEAHLRKKGHKVLERNYRCRLGEIDLVTRDGRMVVFVEVKTRSDQRFGVPLESVHHKKQRKMAQVALFYLSQHRLHYQDARFDVVGVSFAEGRASVEHVENAFELT